MQYTVMIGVQLYNLQASYTVKEETHQALKSCYNIYNFIRQIGKKRKRNLTKTIMLITQRCQWLVSCVIIILALYNDVSHIRQTMTCFSCLSRLFIKKDWKSDKENERMYIQITHIGLVSSGKELRDRLQHYWYTGPLKTNFYVRQLCWST